MTTVAIFNAFVVFLAYLAYKHRSDLFLKISFVLIFLFLALRYNYGNDYNAYLQGFIDIRQGAVLWESEPGWLFLCQLFKPFGFFVMIAFLAAINCLVYYRFIKKYVPISYYWFAVFLFVFNPDFMLIQSSAMRQTVAICFFLVSIDYLYKKDPIRYFFCIGIASLFHNSALILFPLYLLVINDWGFNRINTISIFALFMLLLAFNQYLKPFFDQFINIYFTKYDIYQIAAEAGSGLGVVFMSVIFALILYYSRFQLGERLLLFKISIISYFVIPVGFLFVMISRVGMYLQPTLIAVIPIVAIGLRRRTDRFLFLAIYLFFSLYQFYSFFQSEVWRDAFGHYDMILFAPQVF